MEKTEPNAAVELITRRVEKGYLMLNRAEDTIQEVEKAFRESEQKYRSVVENIGIGVSLISPKMEILSLNKQMQTWFPDIDAAGRPICYQAFNNPPRTQVCSYCPTCKTLQDGQVHEDTTDTPRGDRVINYRIIASPIKDRDENVIAAIEMVEDVTERKRMEAALTESEKIYKELAELLPQTVFELDKDGKVTFANAYGFISTGYTREDLDKGLHASELFTPNDREKATENLRKAMRGHNTNGNEYTILTKDGSTYPAVIYSSPVVRNNRRVGLRGIVVDISDRKRVEHALQESEKKYRLLVNNANSIILHWDAEGTILFMNAYGLDFFGYQEHELIGKNVVGTIVPDTESLTKRDLAALMLDIERNPDTYKNNENENMRKDGSRVWVGWRNKAITDEQGSPIAVLSIGNDITDRKEAENALRTSEERYRSLVENIDFGVNLIDPENNILMVNAAQGRILNKPASEFVGKKCYREFEKRETACPHCPGKKALSTRQPEELETQGVRDDGTRVHVRILAYPAYGGDGAVTGFVEVLEDITERKRGEEALQAREKELEARNRELEEVNTALKVLLKRREEDKKDLEEKVLSNMKNLVLPHVEKLKETKASAQQMHYLESLEGSLNEIISPFSHALTTKYMNLSFVETQVANYVKEGKRTKEIAELMNLSTKTIDSHRKSVRRKLGLTNGKNNLRSFLLSIK